MRRVRWRLLSLQTALAIGLALATATAQPVREMMGPPVPMPADIPLDLALRGAQAALAACDRIHEKAAVAVVDSAEHIRVLLVADGYDRNWLQSVQRRAHTVLRTGMSSGDYGKSLGHDPKKIIAAINADRDLQTGPGRTPILLQVTPGAVPIMMADTMVGAVSVSGNNPKGTSLGYEYMGPVEPCAAAGRDMIEAGLKSRKAN